MIYTAKPNSLTARVPIDVTRLFAQIRLSNIHRICFSFKQNWYRIDQNHICINCNMMENETLEHMFLRCPFYIPYRKFYLDTLLVEYSTQSLLNVLSLGNKVTVYAFSNFLVKALMLRAEYAND